MESSVGPDKPAKDTLRQRLHEAFPRILLEFDSKTNKWFPQRGLRGSRFLGHPGLSELEAAWILENQGRISEMDILLERYPRLP